MQALAALKALKESKKQELLETSGDKKYVKKAEIEEAKLKRLREEEEQERLAKEKRRKVQEAQKAAEPSTTNNTTKDEPHLALEKDEVIRRLRALGQPATLFGEEDAHRLVRLITAEKDMNLEDEALGGYTNAISELEKQRKKESRGGGDASGKEESGKGKDKKSNKEQTDAADEEEDPTMRMFRLASERLQKQLDEEKLVVEERIVVNIQRWMKDWEEDLDSRPEDVKQSGFGKKATMDFKQTEKYFEPFFQRLRRRVVEAEMVAGLWMMIKSMQQRNYAHASDVYFKLAIGNAPWPIGVTSVGIHERSAREKISHVMNESGGAHIMNDEATRKFLQAMKRLVTAVQRLHPTDPSRSVDFNTCTDLTRGTAGAGSHKVALLEAEAKGEHWQALGLSEAPHYIDKDGLVKVPPKWNAILSRAYNETERASGSGVAPSKAPPKPPPKTPPHSTSTTVAAAQ